ncbi:uncharacterized protein LOC106942228 [Poecilia latipinna]|uniref:uncharacterized protein LOC103149937 n=1 Tax=Poecilia formosa TaxID=48698 RepID=UPI0004440C3C|nr:PREDICTED: uncharacterized protein LOC103149937 [Poecilia formosa]XP_014880944.1 PREDICTED: uncharacterized protein LOC106942228 [Poecilia latipinna]XP_014880945.1 PREDICTED: uncharacterized protein LOC106942228 [Poecilia latipinna]XP_016535808.1 PREDICTED: uncharacterized protein LOC103149937 [Poecilia formosa]
MDVSIAVSLIRGQMGTVVERAVNTAVETVLAEMLKVVGVKFEELKAQVVVMKRDVMALQREKALKEKENDNIRAKLRYTELKLKYYRQGVEEELQQRASASALIHIQPPAFTRMQRGKAELPVPRPAHKSAEEVLFSSSQECTSSDSTSRRAVRVCGPSDATSSDSSDLLLPLTLTGGESVDSSAVLFHHSVHDGPQREDVDQVEWTISMQPPAERCAEAPDSIRTLTLLSGQQPAPVTLSPDVDSSMLPPSAPEVKQEVQPSQEEEEEVICIKEEPAEEQEVMATLLLDCQTQRGPAPQPETQRLVAEPTQPSAGQIHLGSDFSPAGSCIYALPQLAGSLPSAAALQPGVLSRQAVRPWTKDLSLYEEYKLRRNELRRRNLNRRRELEKSLPQPLLADLVRERREKTRLRVARWRAKRKLQACLSQTQAPGGAAVLSQAGVSVSRQYQQHQQHSAPRASNSQQRQNSASPHTSSFLSAASGNSVPAILPARSGSPARSLIVRGHIGAPHDHTVTSSSSSSSSSSSYDHVSQSPRATSLTDVHMSQ